jgi:hypothetical protein
MTEFVYFPGRELPPYGEYVRSEDLVIGNVYFRVGFVDREMLMPEMTALVFVGRDLDAEDVGSGSQTLFFQDYRSYARGVRWGMDPPSLDAESEVERFEQFMSRGWFESADEKDVSNIFVFEKALEVLLRCSLKRHARDV